MSILEIKGLAKSFGSLSVLKNVNLTVEEGEVISIIGASGCGKSVFLRCINLLEKPNAGSIFIDGEEITAKNADIDAVRRKMGMVFQKFHLFSHLNVMDNLCLAPTHLLKTERKQAEKEAAELLESVGLLQKANAFPKTLSGGQAQRIAICRALMMKPKLLLLDEPTSALDPTMVGEVLAVIRMLAKQKLTMLIVTHEMKFAEEASTRALFFADNGIYEEGAPADIFNNPKREKTVAFIRQHKFFAYEIKNREDFDLLNLMGGIIAFAEKYAIDDKRKYNLQQIAEELIYEFFKYSYDNKPIVDVTLDIAYEAETDKISVVIKSGGAKYDPFEAKNNADMEHIGVVIVKKIAKKYDYTYENGVNIVSVHF